MSPLLRLTEAVPGARLLGLGSSQPDRVVTNNELAARVDTNDEWIRSRVGIESRPLASRASDEAPWNTAELHPVRNGVPTALFPT